MQKTKKQRILFSLFQLFITLGYWEEFSGLGFQKLSMIWCPKHPAFFFGLLQLDSKSFVKTFMKRLLFGAPGKKASGMLHRFDFQDFCFFLEDLKNWQAFIECSEDATILSAAMFSSRCFNKLPLMQPTHTICQKDKHHEGGQGRRKEWKQLTKSDVWCECGYGQCFSAFERKNIIPDIFLQRLSKLFSKLIQTTHSPRTSNRQVFQKLWAILQYHAKEKGTNQEINETRAGKFCFKWS